MTMVDVIAAMGIVLAMVMASAVIGDGQARLLLRSRKAIDMSAPAAAGGALMLSIRMPAEEFFRPGMLMAVPAWPAQLQPGMN